MSDKTYWLDKRKNVILLIRIFLGLSVLVLCLDLVFHRHELFSWEGWFGFYGFFGFIACVVLVLVAKEMRKLLMRKETYYDE